MYILFWASIITMLIISPIGGLLVILFMCLGYITLYQPAKLQPEEPIDLDIDEELAYFMFMKSQYLHSKEWDTKRRTCLILHKYRCARCNCDNESLEVHHTSGYNLIPHEPQKVLVALCRNCHEIQHKKYGFPSTYKEYMEWNAPLV